MIVDKIDEYVENNNYDWLKHVLKVWFEIKTSNMIGNCRIWFHNSKK